MNAFGIDDLILERDAYAQRRPDERVRMIALRRRRRVALGQALALEFENTETLRYQVQEMLYVEAITDPALAQQEVDAYRRLVPDDTSLVATMLVELEDQAAVRDQLRRWRGLQHHIALEIAGERVGAEEIPGPDEEGHSDDTHSVHFLRFRMTPVQRALVHSGDGHVYAIAEHPHYRARAEIAVSL